MKYKIIILFLVLNISLSCFSTELVKQSDEYSCAPTCSYNLITKACPNCCKNIQQLIKYEKTNKKGTTTYNLCNGINKYFKTQNINTNVEYYGIKRVRKYKVSSNINISELSKVINHNTQVIVNIGIYKKNSDNSFTRQYGHYVNLDSINGDILIVFDPYDMRNEFSLWKTRLIYNVEFRNRNDNEKYCKTKFAYVIENGINYLQRNEYAFINGIIVVHSNTH